nr:hypothetical protein [Nitrosomonas nitrosa]
MLDNLRSSCELIVVHNLLNELDVERKTISWPVYAYGSLENDQVPTDT